MVEWNGWFINAEQVDAVKVFENMDKVRLQIVMRSGEKYYTDYDTDQAAKNAARRFAAQVDREREAGRVERTMELLRGDMTVLRSGIGLLDKRQRRLWRKLRELLPEIGEEDAE